MNTTTTADTVKRSKGVSVSQLNGEIDWKKVKEAGCEFAFLKATEGGAYLDPTFAVNRKEARAAGVDVGYVHFFRPDVAVDLQVANFVKAVGEVEEDALCPVLDCRDAKLWIGQSAKARVQLIVEFCSKVKRALNITPMLCGAPSFFIEMLDSASVLAMFELWISNHRVEEPNVPKPWATWSFWQFSEKEALSGINGDVELSWFNGADISKAHHKRDDSNQNDVPVGSVLEFLWNCAVALYFIGLLAVLLEYLSK